MWSGRGGADAPFKSSAVATALSTFSIEPVMPVVKTVTKSRALICMYMKPVRSVTGITLTL